MQLQGATEEEKRRKKEEEKKKKETTSETHNYSYIVFYKQATIRKTLVGGLQEALEGEIAFQQCELWDVTVVTFFSAAPGDVDAAG